MKILIFSILMGTLSLASTAFGASNVACTCNGSADDTACLQSLINKNSILTFSATQSCVAKSALTLGASKTFNGNGAKLKSHYPLAPGNNTVINDLNITGFYSPVISIGSVSNVTISNNTINGNGANTGTNNQNSGTGIESIAPNTKNIAITGNTIKNASYGILISATNFGPTLSAYQTDFNISGNTITDIGGDAIELNSPINCSYGSNGIVKNAAGQQECEDGGGVMGVGAPYGSGSPGVAMNHFTISNNTLDAAGSTVSGWGFCLGIAGVTNSTIAGNKMQSCKWQCIHIEDAASGLTVEDNQCGNVNNSAVVGTIGPKSTDSSTWAAADSAGILVQNRANTISLTSNTIYKAAGYGIELADVPTVKVVYLNPSVVYTGDAAYDIKATTNDIIGSGYSAIYSHGNTYSTIAENHTSSSWSIYRNVVPTVSSGNYYVPTGDGAIMYSLPTAYGLSITGNTGN